MTIVEILEQTFDGGSTPMGKFIWRRSACILNEIRNGIFKEGNQLPLSSVFARHGQDFKEAVVVVLKRIFRHLLSRMERNKRRTYTCPTLGIEGFKTQEYRADRMFSFSVIFSFDS